MQQDWKSIGAAMEIKDFPPAVMFGDFLIQSQFDTFMAATHTGIGVDPNALVRFGSQNIPVETGTGQNVYRIKDAEIDRLLEEGAREVDPEKRKPIYFKLQERMRDELYIMFMTAYVWAYGHKTGLQNYKNNIYCWDNTWNMNEWWWKK
jgi:peptide/nickel transport system substrate-binding protein